VSWRDVAAGVWLAAVGLFMGLMLGLLRGCSPVEPVRHGLMESATADPVRLHLEAIWAEGTRDAAVATVESLGAQLTGTSDGMKAVATSQAQQATWAAESTEQERAWIAQGWTATAEAVRGTAEAEVTGTALALGGTATMQAMNATATMRAVDARMQSTAQAVQAESLALGVERERLTNQVRAGLPWLGLVVLVGSVVVFGWWLVRVEALRRRVIEKSGQMVLLEKNGRTVAYDPGRNPGGVMVLDHKGQVSQPMLVDAGMQAATTLRDQSVELVKNLPVGRRAPEALLRRSMEPAQVPAPVLEEVLPEIAPWGALSNWRGRALPVGVAGQGRGIMLDLERTPHLLVAGTSGGGKTMEGLRPLAACAAATGRQVVVLNSAGGDFEPLRAHRLVEIVEGGAGRVVEVLEAAAAEVERRSEVLRGAGVSTWGRLRDGQGEIVVVVDELVALAWGATGSLRGRIWRAAIHITSKGRKCGVHFIAATTDPTYRTLARPGLIVRDNCGRMVFRVRDRAASMAALDMAGAETLGEHQFLMGGQDVRRGVAFHPSDEELRAFLSGRAADGAGGGWLAARTTASEPGGQMERIRQMHMEGRSMREIQREVFGYTGGAAYEQVRAVLGGTTEGDTGKNGENGETEQ